MILKPTYFSIAIVILYSCNTSVSPQNKAENFDMPAFFEREIENLQKQNPTVTKTVTNNQSSEIKNIHIINWRNELSQFIAIDLNKVSKEDFTKTQKSDTLIYQTSDHLTNKTSVKVVYQKDSLSEIYIYKSTQNLLFTNEEILHYVSGKHYMIYKKQYVRGLGKNHYAIKGTIQID